MAEPALVVYRGQLHTEQSRISYLLEAVARAFGEVAVAYLGPAGATPAAAVESCIAGIRGAHLVAYLDGRGLALAAALRQIRALQRRSSIQVAIGSTSVQYLRSRADAVVWCVNGIPEERLLSRHTPADRLAVRSMWWSTGPGRRTRLAVVVSEPMGRLVEERCRPRATFVAPCCVETATFAPAARRTRRYVTYLGSAAPWQDLGQLSRIWSKMHGADPALRFRAVSNDPRAAILGSGLPPRSFQLVAATQPAEVAELLWEASLGCLIRRPHLVNRVASPMKAGEYLAAGVPLAVSRIGWDVERLIEHTGAGVVLDWDAPVEETAARLAQFVQSPPAGLELRVNNAASLLDRRRWVEKLAKALTEAETGGEPIS